MTDAAAFLLSAAMHAIKSAGPALAGICVLAALAALVLVWAVAESERVLLAFAAAFGVAYGGFVALLPAFTVDRFGRRSAAGTIGVLYSGRGLALLAAAPLLPALAETLGGYALPLTLVAALGALGTVMLAWSGRRG